MQRENAGVSRTTMESHVNVRSAPTIAPDVEFVCLRSLSRPCRAQRTPLRGTLTNTSGASVMMDTVARIALRRNARQGGISLVEMGPSMDAIALAVAIAVMLLVFADASRDTLETGANTKRFLAKIRLRFGFSCCVVFGVICDQMRHLFS